MLAQPPRSLASSSSSSCSRAWLSFSSISSFWSPTARFILNFSAMVMSCSPLSSWCSFKPWRKLPGTTGFVFGLPDFFLLPTVFCSFYPINCLLAWRNAAISAPPTHPAIPLLEADTIFPSWARPLWLLRRFWRRAGWCDFPWGGDWIGIPSRLLTNFEWCCLTHPASVSFVA